MIRVKRGDGNDKDESKISRELDNQQPNIDKQ
jgi:hypothetical protein